LRAFGKPGRDLRRPADANGLPGCETVDPTTGHPLSTAPPALRAAIATDALAGSWLESPPR
jgi:hypothetical protein